MFVSQRAHLSEDPGFYPQYQEKKRKKDFVPEEFSQIMMPRFPNKVVSLAKKIEH